MNIKKKSCFTFRYSLIVSITSAIIFNNSSPILLKEESTDWKSIDINEQNETLSLDSSNIRFKVLAEDIKEPGSILNSCELKIKTKLTKTDRCNEYEINGEYSRLIPTNNNNDFLLMTYSPADELFLVSDSMSVLIMVVSDVEINQPEWIVAQTPPGFFTIVAYDSSQICFFVIARLLLDSPSTKDSPKKKCSKVSFNPVINDEKIAHIESLKENIYVFTNRRVYLFDKSFEMELSSGKAVFNIQDLRIVNNFESIYLSDNNKLYYLSDYRKEEKTLLINDILDSPILLRTNGKFTILREKDSYAGFGYRIINHQVKINEDNQQKFYFNSEYHTALTMKDTIIFFGKNGYMFYKTDFGGFIRSSNVPGKNILGIGYENKKENRVLQYQFNPDTKKLTRQSLAIEELEIECEPELELVRMSDNTHSAQFVIEIMKEGKTEMVGHKINWIKKITAIGWALWGAILVIGGVAIYCVVNQIFDFKKDNNLIATISRKHSMNRINPNRKDSKLLGMLAQNDLERINEEKSEGSVKRLNYPLFARKKEFQDDTDDFHIEEELSQEESWID